MAEKLNYSGNSCASGILVSFSGLDLSLDQTYRITFDNVNTIPITTVLKLNPTGYFLTPSETSPVLQTLFSSRSNISDNSSVNLISLSVYDDNNNLIYRDYKTINCENLCGSGVPLPPTPSVTPTMTPTNTPTPTPTPPPPSPPPLLIIRAAFDRTINQFAEKTILVRAKAYGNLNNTYAYSFGTDMSGVDLKISNPSGNITITEIPTYVYTNITLPEKNKQYSLEFGLSDGTNNVQSAAIFSFKDGAISSQQSLIPLQFLDSPPSIPVNIVLNTNGNVIGTNGIYLRYRRIDSQFVSNEWSTIYVPQADIQTVPALAAPSVSAPQSGNVSVIDLKKFLPNGTYQIEYDIINQNNVSSVSIMNANKDIAGLSVDSTKYRLTETIENSDITRMYIMRCNGVSVEGKKTEWDQFFLSLANNTYTIPAKKTLSNNDMEFGSFYMPISFGGFLWSVSADIQARPSSLNNISFNFGIGSQIVFETWLPSNQSFNISNTGTGTQQVFVYNKTGGASGAWTQSPNLISNSFDIDICAVGINCDSAPSSSFSSKFVGPNGKNYCLVNDGFREEDAKWVRDTNAGPNQNPYKLYSPTICRYRWEEC